MTSSSGFNGWNKKTLGVLGGIIVIIISWNLLGFIPTILIAIAAVAIGFVKWYNSETEDTDDASDSSANGDKTSASPDKPTPTSKAGTGLAKALRLTEDEADEFITAYQQFLSDPRPFILFYRTLSTRQQELLTEHFDTLFERLGLAVTFRRAYYPSASGGRDELYDDASTPSQAPLIAPQPYDSGQTSTVHSDDAGIGILRPAAADDEFEPEGDTDGRTRAIRAPRFDASSDPDHTTITPAPGPDSHHNTSRERPWGGTYTIGGKTFKTGSSTRED